MNPKLQVIFICLLFAAICRGGTVPAFSTVQSNSTSIPLYGKLEVTTLITATNALSFDYDSMVMQAILTAPNGQIKTIDGFLYNNDGGNATWMIRFTPTQVGTWTYHLRAINSVGSTSSSTFTFNCVASTKKGFVRKNTSNYLAYDNGNQFIPIGQNLAWEEDRNLKKYFALLGKMNAQGCNAIRYYFAPWFNDIEWTHNPTYPYSYQGLKKYYLPNAMITDSLLDSLDVRDMYAQVTLFLNTNVSTDTYVIDTFVFGGQWQYNPLNAINGGPCTDHQQFFTSSVAKADYKNRLRYIQARWGYSPHILAWEIGSEMELSVSYYNGEYDTTKQIISDWVDEMTAYVKSNDVNDHLRTVSYAYAHEGKQNLSNPNIDLTQTHQYNQDFPIKNFENAIVGAFLQHHSAYRKPFMVAEYGLYYDNSGWQSLRDDPSGIHVHNALWSSMFSGSYGPALNWWWDTYIDTLDLYHLYKPLSKVITTVPFLQKNMHIAKAKSVSANFSSCFMTPLNWHFEKPTDTIFNIDQRGVYYPDNLSLSEFLFGINWFPNLHTSVIINVQYASAGDFIIHTGSKDVNPNLTIYVDSVLQLSVNNAQSDTIYTVPLPAGPHQLRINNRGDSWIALDSFEFTDYQAPLRIFALQSEDSTIISAYMLNGNYNWQYMRDNNQVPPLALTNQSILFDNMLSGSYNLEWYSTTTGNLTATDTATAINNQLQIYMPSLAWDVFLKISKRELSSGIKVIDDLLGKVYPNPFNGEIVIEKKNYDPMTMEIQSSLGQVLFTTVVYGEKETIPMLDLPAGIYLLRLKNKTGVQEQKMIRQ